MSRSLLNPSTHAKQAYQKSSQPSTTTAVRKTSTQAETDTLKLKKSWEIALAPGKQLPMQAIMAYMGGNSLQVFTIMMVAMLFKGPLQAIAATNSTFARLETEGNKRKMGLVKVAYVAMQCLLLGLGVWKIGQMGLLPTTQSDWLAFESERVCVEKAYFAI